MGSATIWPQTCPRCPQAYGQPQPQPFGQPGWQAAPPQPAAPAPPQPAAPAPAQPQPPSFPAAAAPSFPAHPPTPPVPAASRLQLVDGIFPKESKPRICCNDKWFIVF